MSQRDDAAAFRALHAPGRLLVVANVWDAASAALFRSAGAEALATSSAALCWTHGYADGGAFPRELLLRAIGEIVRVARVPVSVDVEAGYSDDPERVGALALEVARAGGAGINLEDGSGAPELLAAKIEAVRRSLAGAGLDLFVNARVDVYLKQLVPAERALGETLSRLPRYERAGADGVFVPALKEPAAIREVVAACPLPLNLLVVPGLAPIAELRALGVRRVSAGSGIAAAALGAARRVAQQLLAEGRYDAMWEHTAAYADLNRLFA